MVWIRIPKRWEISESQVTPESVYWNRRRFLKALGLGAVSLAGGFWPDPLSGAGDWQQALRATIPPPHKPYPAPRNTRYQVDRPLTPELIAAQYNNFYEFSTMKDEVWKLAQRFHPRPWHIEITGEVHRPVTRAIDELLKRFPLEERIYRFRCVEAWSMVVPWTGIPFKKILDFVEPTSKARYVRFVSFYRPEEAPGQKDRSYPWPYFEGLTLAEASNELTLLATGIYGHPLPNQHGAPARIIVPWKYGYKNIKSVVKIELTRKRPPTFWNTLVPDEYDFWSNVNPKVPHPRWSQATERDIATGRRIPTLLYNGYAEEVASLYAKEG